MNILAKLGIASTYFLSEKIKTEKDIVMPLPEEVAKRALVIAYMIGVYYDVNSEDLKSLIDKQGLSDSLSVYETEILAKSEYDEEDMNNAGWWQESLQVLCWALKLTDEVNPLNEAEMTLADQLPLSKSIKKFVSNAMLISQNQLFEQYFIYNTIYHYLEKNEHILLDADRILERYNTLKWLVGEEKVWI